MVVEVLSIADKHRSQAFVVNCGLIVGAGVLQLN